MISIVTPAYNAEKFIAATIESVQSQSIQDWEMIVVDDQSKDRTREIVLEKSKLDSRIRLVDNPSKGVSNTRNTGIRQAQYEWIALLDADDLFLPSKLEQQLAAAREHPDVIVWGTFAHNAGADGKVFDVACDGPPSIDAYHASRRRNQVILLKTSTTMFRKEHALEVGGFDPNYDGIEDIEFWSRLAELGPIVTLPEPLIIYRFHPNSLTVHMIRNQIVSIRFLAERRARRLRGEDISYAAFVERDRHRNPLARLATELNIYAFAYWRKAGLMFTNGRWVPGLGCLLVSFLSNPFVIGYRMVRKVYRPLARRFRRDSTRGQVQ